jgi:NAD(P)-dependent dehydrogenase (short-subunit alcohol dehydrogenase family)
MAAAPFDLNGRTALITGASSGLGARFARMLAAQGVNVVLGARRLDRLTCLAEEIRAAGGTVLPVEMDVEDEASIIAAYDQAQAAFGTVDTIIANAGMNAQGPATNLPSDDLAQLLRINVQGVYLTAREGARRLIASEDSSRGRIILLGSVGSLRPLAGLTAYSTSKAGVAMLGKGLAREWARHGINVNTICPGWIKTELNTEWLDGEGGQKLIKTFPRRRVMNPEHLDGLVTFLSSDASSAITGGVFAADDGQSLA